MDIRGYAHIRKRLDDAGIVAGISPVPSTGKEVTSFTISYSPEHHESQAVVNAFARTFPSGEMRVTAITPEIRVVSITDGTIMCEDVLDWHVPQHHDMTPYMADW